MSKEAMKLALDALESCDAAHITDGGHQWYDEKLVDTACEALREALAEQIAPVQQELTDLQKDAANLLFALHDAWPYVHQWCTIESKKNSIAALIRKHGDFADPFPQPAQQQEPVACSICNGSGHIAFDDLTRRNKNDHKWGRCLHCQPYTSPQPAPEDSSAVQSAPVVPDAIHHTDTSETLEYIQGWNDCRQAMLRSNT